METTSRQTPLYDWHLAHHAKMALFAGYRMPMWYASAKSEHLAVLTHAGLFDTSHMDTLTVCGQDALDLLQLCFTKDLQRCTGQPAGPLPAGRCVYGAFLNDQGGCIDDAIVFRQAASDYMVVVNAGMGGVIADHLESRKSGPEVEIQNWSGKLGKVDLQGPASVRILRGVLENPDEVLASLPYFAFKGHLPTGHSGENTGVRLKDGTPALISRTGYTGEVGFEIFCPAADLPRVWDMLLDAGTPHGLLPCGLAARDSLRAGAVLPLSHQDIGHWPFCRHPWSFALPYTADGTAFTKSFIGDQALLAATDAPYTLSFVGFDPRKITPAEARAWDADRDIGAVLTCATDMGIGRVEEKIVSIASPDRPADFKPAGLSCGFVKVDRPLEPGRRISLRDSRRSIEVQICEDIRPARTARRALKHF